MQAIMITWRLDVHLLLKQAKLDLSQILPAGLSWQSSFAFPESKAA